MRCSRHLTTASLEGTAASVTLSARHSKPYETMEGWMGFENGADRLAVVREGNGGERITSASST
jgi:hypothetical protein